jgi:hypothetical protein
MKVILFLLPIAILGCLLALKLVRPGLYSRYVMHEDGPVENLQAVFFLASSVLCFLCWRLSRDRHSGLVSIGFLSAAAMFFFVFGEEISWGQRILGFATPEGLAGINRQDELSLHNLDAVQDKLIYGTLAFLSWAASGGRSSQSCLSGPEIAWPRSGSAASFRTGTSRSIF